MAEHGICREIGIDAGHRVPLHGSKCKHPHGHRYKIEANCTGPLFDGTEQDGMVIDFGFLKDEMMSIIDAHCDHGQILWVDDPFVRMLVPMLDLSSAREGIARVGFFFLTTTIQVDANRSIPVKLYLLPCAPTAENLARHWFERLAPRVLLRTNEQAKLSSVVVHETPNCRAVYPV